MPGALIARKEYAEKNPELVAKFLAVYLRGVNFIRHHKKEAIAMMADFYARTGTELPAKYLEREIDTRPMFALQEQLSLLADENGPSTADKWFNGLSDYLVSTGTLAKPLKASSFIDPQYMQRVASTPNSGRVCEPQQLARHVRPDLISRMPGQRNLRAWNT